jgi:hypothetical protein
VDLSSAHHGRSGGYADHSESVRGERWGEQDRQQERNRSQHEDEISRQSEENGWEQLDHRGRDKGYGPRQVLAYRTGAGDGHDDEASTASLFPLFVPGGNDIADGALGSNAGTVNGKVNWLGVRAPLRHWLSKVATPEVAHVQFLADWLCQLVVGPPHGQQQDLEQLVVLLRFLRRLVAARPQEGGGPGEDGEGSTQSSPASNLHRWATSGAYAAVLNAVQECVIQCTGARLAQQGLGLS